MLKMGRGTAETESVSVVGGCALATGKGLPLNYFPQSGQSPR